MDATFNPFTGQLDFTGGGGLAPTVPATPSIGGLLYGEQSGNGKVFTLTAAGAALIEATDAAAQRTAMAVRPGEDVGYPIVPQNSQAGDYTTVLSDSGKHIYHPGSDGTGRQWTIDSNANVPYVIGTAITFVNDAGAGVITLVITDDTMILAGSGDAGARSLAANGMATALKITSTRWIISGTGLT